MEINDYVFKISGKAHLDKPIDLSRKYKIGMDGAIVSSAQHDNEDGTFTQEYKYKPIIVTIIEEGGEIIHARDLRSRSQQLRSAIWKKWKNEVEPISFDDFYDREMLKIIGEQMQ